MCVKTLYSLKYTAHPDYVHTTCWYLVVYEPVVKVQTGPIVLLGAAGSTGNSWSLVRQKAQACSLVLQSLTLKLQYQVQQGLWILRMAAPTLQQQHRDLQ